MMINEMKNSRSSDLLPMFYDCKYYLFLVSSSTSTSLCHQGNVRICQLCTRFSGFSTISSFSFN